MCGRCDRASGARHGARDRRRTSSGRRASTASQPIDSSLNTVLGQVRKQNAGVPGGAPAFVVYYQFGYCFLAGALWAGAAGAAPTGLPALSSSTPSVMVSMKGLGVSLDTVAWNWVRV